MPNASARDQLHAQKHPSLHISWEPRDTEESSRDMDSARSPDQAEDQRQQSPCSGAVSTVAQPSPSGGDGTPTTAIESLKSEHRGQKCRPRLRLRLRDTMYNPGLELINSGSVARDHLANERTILAYVRTSLALSSMGVALVQLFTLSNSASGTKSALHVYARPLGATGVVLGLLVLLIGVVRYFTVQTALTRGNFPVARVTVIVVGLVLTALICVMFGVLVASRT
ncbi:hypothetical protein OE88DRAFT_1657571 [Heliocybe sulcata]|uniref:DUF202 domain-containing protein n=1 Tax=Heliocybe sulcata TaxID=5364 RepID=A0A5C3N3N3_9AGAM|nr:hypothetical protein OE88DRAFT_1657571 [Heliocybe sulcata]